MTFVVNLFSGPGAGKSTTATGVFSLLKLHDVNSEYISEYAKDKAWEGTLGVYYNQFKILGEQHDRQFRCLDKVDVMITDSPILQQCAYVDDEFYEKTCLELFNQFDNINYFIERRKPYNPMGRKHDEESAKMLDVRIRELLKKYDCYTSLPGIYSSVNAITSDVLERLKIPMKYYITE